MAKWFILCRTNTSLTGVFLNAPSQRHAIYSALSLLARNGSSQIKPINVYRIRKQHYNGMMHLISHHNSIIVIDESMNNTQNTGILKQSSVIFSNDNITLYQCGSKYRLDCYLNYPEHVHRSNNISHDF